MSIDLKKVFILVVVAFVALSMATAGAESLIRPSKYRTKTPKGWAFKVYLENDKNHKQDLNIWLGEKIIFATTLLPLQTQVLWLHGDRHYLLQWAPRKNEDYNQRDWKYRGFKLSSKAAFIFNRPIHLNFK